MTITGGNTSVRFGRVDGYQAPGWPDASAPKRYHFDLQVDDLAAAVARCLDLGASKPEFQPGADRSSSAPHSRSGKKRLDKLTARDVRLFVTRLRESCPCCRNGWDTVRDEPRCCAKQVPECCGSRLSIRMVQFIHAV